MAEDTLGRGTIELVADARQFRAQMQQAKKSLDDLGRGQSAQSTRASRSIDAYINKLRIQNATLGRSAREVKLYELAIRGASDAQLRAADTALRFREAQERNARSVSQFGLRQLGIGIGFIATARQLSSLSDQYTKYTALLRLATIGQQGFADAQEDVQRISRAAQADISSVAQLYSRVALATRDLGIEQSTAADITETISLALKASGASAAESASAILQIGQAFGSGVLRGEEFNAVAEAAPRLLRALADSLQVPVGDLREMAKEGKLTADVLARELPKALGDLRREAQSIRTIGGAVQNLRNRFVDLVGSTGEASGAVSAVADAINSLADNLDVLKVPFQTIVVLAGNFAYVFRTLGIAIAGVQEQLAGFARGGVKGFLEARKLVTDILAEERRKFDEWEKSVLSGGKALKTFAADAEDAALGASIQAAGAAARRGAAASGGGREAAREAERRRAAAERLAQAQRQSEIESIRRANNELVGEYARAGRLVEATRAAGLISEQEASEARLGFIRLNLQAQESALQAEIDILRRRKFSGDNAAVEQIENASKIAELESRLARERANASAGAETIAIAERGRNVAIARTLDEARVATDAYIASLQKRNALEIAGIGRGAQFRERAAGEADVEARFAERRQQLEAELRRGDITKEIFDAYLRDAARAYQAEIGLYRDRNAQIDALQLDWRNGAREALQNYLDEVRNAAKTFEDVFTNSLQHTEDALTDFVTKGEIDLKSFAQTITGELNRAFVRERITGPLAEAVKGGQFDGLLGAFGVGGLGASTPSAAAVGAGAAAAEGAAFAGAVTAAGTTFSTSTIAAGTSMSATLTAAAASFAATITSAGASFAASVQTSSGGDGLAGLASLALDSFATGTPYVPRTGLYQLHQGERVVSAAENAATGGRVVNLTANVQVGPGADRRTAAQMGIEFARSAQRELARGTA